MQHNNETNRRTDKYNHESHTEARERLIDNERLPVNIDHLKDSIDDIQHEVNRKRVDYFLTIAKRIEECKTSSIKNVLSFNESIISGNREQTELEKCHTTTNKMRDVFSMIDRMYSPRNPMQVDLCESFLAASACAIYGKFIKTHAREIMKRQGWSSLVPVHIVQAPRKVGKSFTQVCIIIAILLGIKGKCKIGIFVPRLDMGNRSEGLLALVEEILQAIIPDIKFKPKNEDSLGFVYEGFKKQVHTFASTSVEINSKNKVSLFLFLPSKGLQKITFCSRRTY